MDLIPGIDASASALDAQRVRMEAISQNLANLHTTKTAEGGAYKRQLVSFETMLNERGNSLVKVGDITVDESPGLMRYDPQHPHANDEGMVEGSNVSMSHEMVDLLSATRAYEANLAAVKMAKQMAQKTSEIGR